MTEQQPPDRVVVGPPTGKTWADLTDDDIDELAEQTVAAMYYAEGLDPS